MRNKILFLSILLIIFICVGIFVLNFFFFKPVIKEKKKLIIPSQLSLVGNLLEINNNIFTIKVNHEGLSIKDEKSELYKIKFNDDTEIVRYLKTKKSKEEFTKEQIEYEKIITEYKNENKSIFGIIAPSWNMSEKININELQVGDLINVIVQYNNEVFLAKYISINPEEKQENNKEQIIKVEYEGKINDIDKNNNIIKFDYFGDILDLNCNLKTEYLLKEVKSSEQFKTEQEEYNLAIKSGKEHSSLITPSWFKVEKINIDDLEIGWSVYVYIKKENNYSVLERLEIVK